MAEPTAYDLEQDERLDQFEEIVTTTYQEPSQIEYSYPVVDQPMNDEQWQYVTLGMGDGILDDGGGAYWLRLNGTEANTNSTNSMILAVSETTGTAQGMLKGFYHRLMADKVLTLPGVTSETIYYVTLQYDPLGHDTPTGPINVRVVTSLDYTQGKHYVVLWTVKRKPNQLLTDAEVTRLRPRVSPQIYVWDESHRPRADKVLWGTMCFVGASGNVYRSTSPSDDGVDTGDRKWVKHTDSDLKALTPDAVQRGDGSGYEYPGHGGRLTSTRIGSLVVLEGRVQRESGARFLASQTDGYYIRTLPSAHRPPSERRFVTKAAGFNGTHYANVRILASGEVYVYVTQDIDWVGVDGCVFTV